LKNDVPAQAASWDVRTVRLCAVGKASPNCALASRFVEGEGTYSVKDDGTVVFAPLSSFVGTATTIRYQVVDSKGATYSATLTPVVLAAELPATGSNLRLLTLVALVVMAAGALLHRERFRM
jgi:LPXTG-motif cell wall-anchored protein